MSAHSSSPCRTRDCPNISDMSGTVSTCSGRRGVSLHLDLLIMLASLQLTCMTASSDQNAEMLGEGDAPAMHLPGDIRLQESVSLQPAVSTCTGTE